MSRTSARLPRSAAAAALEPIVVVVVVVVRLARVDVIVVVSDKGNPESSCRERVVGGSHW